MVDENTALVRRWIAFAERGFAGDFADFIADTYTGHLGDQTMDRVELERLERAFLEAFPDTTHTIHDLIAKGDRVVARLTMNATHRGESAGIPATNRAVELTA